MKKHPKRRGALGMLSAQYMSTDWMNERKNGWREDADREVEGEA